MSQAHEWIITALCLFIVAVVTLSVIWFLYEVRRAPLDNRLEPEDQAIVDDLRGRKGGNES